MGRGGAHGHPSNRPPGDLPSHSGRRSRRGGAFLPHEADLRLPDRPLCPPRASRLQVYARDLPPLHAGADLDRTHRGSSIDRPFPTMLVDPAAPFSQVFALHTIGQVQVGGSDGLVGGDSWTGCLTQTQNAGWEGAWGR